jgi:glycosyltransferase involved in cell wall biosynthesis
MPRRTRVCFDLTPAEMRDRYGGFARYGFSMLEALVSLPDAADLELLALSHSARPPVPAREALDGRVLTAPTISARRHRLQRLWLSGRLLRAAGVDLFHSLHPAALPLASRCTVVVTAHDLISLVCPDPSRTVRARVERLDDRLRQRVRHRRGDHFIAISDTTRHDLVERLRVPPGAITVIRHGIDTRVFSPNGRGDACPDVRREWGLPTRYFLSVGSDHYRKNQFRLFEAWRLVCDQIGEGLVLVGRSMYGDTFARIDAEAARAGLTGRVRWLSGVPDSSIAEIYRGATALVAPSLYEGFGMTLVEAMACGTPVAASHAAAHVEVAGDAAMYFDPASTEDIGGVLVRMAGDPGLHEDLRQRGLARVSGFTWTDAARATMALYRHLLGLPPIPDTPRASPARSPTT